MAWLVPIFSVYLTKHLVILFVRTPRDEIIATRIFVGVCFLIGLSFVLTAAGSRWGISPAYTSVWRGYGPGAQDGHSIRRFLGDATVAGICSISIIILPGMRTGFTVRAGLAAVQFVCVLVSGKRLAILSLGLVSGFLFLGIKNRRQRIGAFALGVLMIAALFVFLPDTGILDRFDEARSALSGERQNDERMLRFGRAIFAIGQNPIIGAGVGGVAWIHNGVLEILANMGMFGIPILISLVIPSIRSTIPSGGTHQSLDGCDLGVSDLAVRCWRPSRTGRKISPSWRFFLGMTETHQRLRWIESMRRRPRTRSVAAAT